MGNTALFMTSTEELVDLLIRVGADLNLQNEVMY